MSIQTREFKDAPKGCRSYAVYDGFNCEFLCYQACCFSEEKIREYEKKNPYPKGETDYEFEDLVNDFTCAEGSITFNCKLEETATWIEEMVYNLL